MGFVRGSWEFLPHEPIVSHDPKSLFGREIRIDIGGGRELALEFLEPEDPNHIIDIAAVVHNGDAEPEDLVVLRPSNEKVEILAISRDLQQWKEGG